MTNRDLEAQYKEDILKTKAKSWKTFVERNLVTNAWRMPY